MKFGTLVPLSPSSLPARGTPVGTPLLRSDPSAVPQVGERDLDSLRELHVMERLK